MMILKKFLFTEEVRMKLFDDLPQIETMFFDAFEKISEAVYFCDIDGNLIYVNQTALKLDGFTLSQIKGKAIAELYGLDALSSPLLKTLATRKPVNEEQVTYYVNNREVVQLCNAAPCFVDGRLMGAYSVQRDITEMKQIIETNISLQWEVLRQKERLLRQQSVDCSLPEIVGESALFLKSKQTAYQAAKNDSAVMLVGSTGSGKELFAHSIHDYSDRAKGPFLALNCAAIPEGLLEGILFGTAKGVYTGAIEREGLLSQADGGTIFLDEINSMPLSSQAKLLRVLEEKKVYKLGVSHGKQLNVRIISSSNELPQAAVDRGGLREDLFYRLSVVYIQIPSLKERADDIPLLVRYFLGEYNERFSKNVIGVADDVMAFFADFSWPGNVRQLKHCIESAMNFTDDGQAISFSALPPYLFEKPASPKVLPAPPSTKAVGAVDATTLMETIRDDEKAEISAALKKARGNMAAAARELGITRQTMVYRVKKYGLK